MKTKFLTTVLGLILAVATFAQSGTTGNLSWTLSNGTLTISGTGSMPDYIIGSGVGRSPWYNNSSITNVIISDGITNIGNGAFRYCTNLTSITIPYSITSIGVEAFSNCSSLSSITIPKSITSLGARAFLNTFWYNNQPNGVVYADKILYKYKGTMLPNTSIVIQDGTTSIADEAFDYCKELTSVTIPNSVTFVGRSAFSYCSSLTSVNIPNSVKSIGSHTFSSCSSLASVTISNSITSIEEYTFNYCSSLTSVTIPNSVTSIGDYAFNECSSLTSITIPNSVISIGNWAFTNCKKIASLNFGTEIQTIKNRAFQGCISLSAISIKREVPPTLLAENGIVVFDGVNKIGCILTVPIGSKTTYQKANQWSSFQNINESNFSTITQSGTCGDSVFWKLTNDSILTIYGDGDIPDYSFSNHAPWYNYRLQFNRVNIQEGITSIGSYNFHDCIRLSIINIPNSVIKIGSVAFAACNSLKEITVPDNLQILSSNTFNSSGGLCFINANPSNTRFCSIDGILYNKTQTRLVSCPVKKTGMVSIPADVTEIGWSAFYNCTELTSITIPDNVISIGNYAFGYCTKIISITIPDKVVSVGSYAFRYCSNLTSVTVGKKVKSIGNAAFEKCDLLATMSFNAINCEIMNNVFTTPNTILNTINFGDSVNIVPKSSFYNCQGIASVSLPNSVTSIGGSAFSNCTKLSSIKFPINLVDIGAGAFYKTPWYENQPDGKVIYAGQVAYQYKGTMPDNTSIALIEGTKGIAEGAFPSCNGLIYIIIPKSVINIGNSAFNNCQKLTSISISDGLVNIGDKAFKDCRTLPSISIPNSVKSIGKEAFSNCYALTSIKLSDNISKIDSSTFYGSGIKTLDIPKSVTKIEYYAFAYSGINSITIPNSVKTVGKMAFYFSYQLTTVNVDAKTIGYMAFNNCEKLNSLTIGNNVDTIENNAFSSCKLITTVSLPNNVTYIGDEAFKYCDINNLSLGSFVTNLRGSSFANNPRLRNVRIAAINPPSMCTNKDSLVFQNCNIQTCVLEVPIGSKTKYQAADQWKDFYTINEVDFPNSTAQLEADKLNIYTVGNELRIEGVESGKSVQLYNLSGLSVYRAVLSGNKITLPALNKGIYIVKIDDLTAKVLL